MFELDDDAVTTDWAAMRTVDAEHPESEGQNLRPSGRSATFGPIWPPCEVCKQPVTAREGILQFWYGEWDNYRKALAEWEAKAREGQTGKMTVYNYSVFKSRPSGVRWHWGHVACMPPDRRVYEIDPQRMTTLAEAMFWTLQMQSKEWYRDTNWYHLVHAVFPEIPFRVPEAD